MIHAIVLFRTTSKKGAGYVIQRGFFIRFYHHSGDLGLTKRK